MRFFKYNTIREYTIFFFLFIVIVIGLTFYSIYSNYKIDNLNKVYSILDNTYLKKTIREITNNLKPRYTFFEYSSKSGDNHQNIVDKLDISKKEKKKY